MGGPVPPSPSCGGREGSVPVKPPGGSCAFLRASSSHRPFGTQSAQQLSAYRHLHPDAGASRPAAKCSQPNTHSGYRVEKEQLQGVARHRRTKPDGGRTTNSTAGVRAQTLSSTHGTGVRTPQHSAVRTAEHSLRGTVAADRREMSRERRGRLLDTKPLEMSSRRPSIGR
eukprot:GHVT01070409.1.p1 GENE.GHVT01070409.1~~GHVT01070409.1.p1  ORF type:complete len:170 (+),score=22.82 GHVT01070409.1:291-800(+)